VRNQRIILPFWQGSRPAYSLATQLACTWRLARGQQECHRLLATAPWVWDSPWDARSCVAAAPCSADPSGSLGQA
jgi:hypothetical protein